MINNRSAIVIFKNHAGNFVDQIALFSGGFFGNGGRRRQAHQNMFLHMLPSFCFSAL